MTIETLSRRRLQVAAYAILGMTNKEIGLVLNINEATIKVHLGDIYKKLNVKGRLDLIAKYRDPISRLFQYPEKTVKKFEHVEYIPTSNEIRVLDGLKNGLQNKAIAESMGVSEAVIKYTVKSLMTSLKRNNRHEVLLWWLDTVAMKQQCDVQTTT